MAQPSYAIEYLGAIEAPTGISVTSNSLLATFPTATVVKFKTKGGAKVAINGSVQIEIDYNDESYLSAGKEYVFDRPCVLAIGIYKAVV